MGGPNLRGGWRRSEHLKTVKTLYTSESDHVGVKPVLRTRREYKHQRQSPFDKKSKKFDFVVDAVEIYSRFVFETKYQT